MMVVESGTSLEAGKPTKLPRAQAGTLFEVLRQEMRLRNYSYRTVEVVSQPSESICEIFLSPASP